METIDSNMLNKYGYNPVDTRRSSNDEDSVKQPGKHKLLSLIKMESGEGDSIKFTTNFINKNLFTSTGLIVSTRIYPKKVVVELIRYDYTDWVKQICKA
jgi:hypothetical protein